MLLLNCDPFPILIDVWAWGCWNLLDSNLHPHLSPHTPAGWVGGLTTAISIPVGRRPKHVGEPSQSVAGAGDRYGHGSTSAGSGGTLVGISPVRHSHRSLRSRTGDQVSEPAACGRTFSRTKRITSISVHTRKKRCRLVRKWKQASENNLRLTVSSLFSYASNQIHSQSS